MLPWALVIYMNASLLRQFSGV
ncbi:protein of unknown function [Burkholderia multivorans]